MSIVSDDVKLVIELVGLALAVGTIVWRTSNLATKLEDDGKARKNEIAEIKIAIGGRMDKVETRLDAMQSILVSEAKQDVRIESVEKVMNERVSALDQRSLAQGARIDSTAKILNDHMDTLKGRLEAINNIVAGHTAQLNNLPHNRHG